MADNSLTSDKKVNLAMCLTLCRIGLAPCFVIVFFMDGVIPAIAALGIVCLSELSDLLDGMVARKKNLVTDLGKIIDPLADSIARLTVFICFLKANIAPVAYVLLIFYRDVTVATVRTYCGFRGIVVSARQSGKIKAIFQATGILTILVVRTAALWKGFDQPYTLYFWIMTVVTTVTVWSGFDYFLAARFSRTPGSPGSEEKTAK